jgi:hypothetical protein
LYCENNNLQTLPFLPRSLDRLNCRYNPLIVIRPTHKPIFCNVPDYLQRFYSHDDYPFYRKKYQTYFYLITYLALLPIAPVLLSNEAWWFPGTI